MVNSTREAAVGFCIRARLGSGRKEAKRIGLQSLRVRTPFPNSVPKGRLNLAQDASPGLDLKGRPVPQGRLKIGRDAILDNLQPSLRDLIISIRPHRNVETFSLPIHPHGWSLFSANLLIWSVNRGVGRIQLCTTVEFFPGLIFQPLIAIVDG